MLVLLCVLRVSSDGAGPVLSGPIKYISFFCDILSTQISVIHCPLSGGPEAHTVTAVKSKVPTLEWTVPLSLLQRPTLSLQ